MQRRNKLAPYPTSFVEKHLKEARKCKASLDYHWLAYISKGTQPAMKAEQRNTTQPLNDSESRSNNNNNNQCKMEQQQAAKRRRMLQKHLQQSKGGRKG